MSVNRGITEWEEEHAALLVSRLTDVLDKARSRDDNNNAIALLDMTVLAFGIALASGKLWPFMQVVTQQVDNLGGNMHPSMKAMIESEGELNEERA